jgi:hypothetical protein
MKTNVAEKTRDLTREECKDLEVLALFTAVFCQSRHGDRERTLPPGSSIAGLSPGKHLFCTECLDFLIYAADRRLRCPLDPKPICKHCPVHCYRPGHRERVREIMRFSGKRLILKGRLDLLWHYYF